MENITTAGAPRQSKTVVELTVEFNDAQHVIAGREAWALHVLLERGEEGATPITTPGPRWSDYVFKLRKRGLVVETVDERHAGPFAGRHARYKLRSPVRVLKVVREGEARDATA
jgi:hypothetical protein